LIASYIFSSEGLVTLDRYVATDTLFAFDLDGTLSPIVENYTAAQVSEPVRSSLLRLVKHAKVAVITGRSRNNAQAILGFEPHLLVGNHGAEWPPQEGRRNWQQIELCLKWQESLNHMLSYVQGIDIEFKGESVSVHYRKAVDPEKALSLINAAIEKLEVSPRIMGGKFVVNLLAMEAFTKREALVEAMERFGLVRSIYFGDDVTDEEVFQQTGADILGIHVGKDDQTAAQYYLNNQSEMPGLLNDMVRIIESKIEVTSSYANEQKS
jgi:trehalose 6-phosphate phosphatase